MNHATLTTTPRLRSVGTLATTIASIFFTIGLLLSSAAIQSSYNTGTLDSIAGTNNGGTGFGPTSINNQATSIGYVTTHLGMSDTMVVNASTVQPDGKILVVGQDSTATEMTIIRYNINGTVDATITQGAIGTGAASATGVAVQPDGKIVVCGTCTTAGGPSFFIARFIADLASLDVTGASANPFNGATGFITGNIGTILSTGTTGPLATSSIDTSSAVAVDTAGNILITGTTVITQATKAGIPSCMYVVRYTSAGLLDTTFNLNKVVGGTNTSAILTAQGVGLVAMTAVTNILTAHGMALDAAGNIVVVGSTSLSTNMFMIRMLNGAINPGQLDTTGFASPNGYLSFNTGGTDVGYAVGFQSATNSNRIIVAGTDGINSITAGVTNAGVLDTSTFGTSSNGYIAENFGTVSTAYGVTIQTGDKIVIGGNATGSPTVFFIARFVANGSALDTSSASGNIPFNGVSGFTTTNISTPNLGDTLSLQSNGCFILAGTVGGAPTKFGVARYLGDNNIQGCMDITYNPAISTSPGSPGFSVYPTDTTATNLPKVVAIYPLSTSGQLYALTTTATNSQIVELTATGNNQATPASIGQTGGADVIADSNNRAVIIGSAAGNGYIARYVNIAGNMTIDGTFAGGTVHVENHAASFLRVGEQKAERIVVMGQYSPTTTSGVLVAYNEAGALANTLQSLCPPFGPSGQGYMTVAASNYYDMIIDANDGIYVALKTSGGGATIQINKYLSDGIALSTSDFGVGGTVDTTWIAANYGNPSICFDNNGNIVVVAVLLSTGEIDFQVYTAATGTNLIVTGSILPETSLLVSPVLTKLQCDTNNRLIFTGYDNDDFFVGRMIIYPSGTYALDTAANGSTTPFAPYSNCPGILKTMYSDNNPTYFAGITPPFRFSNSVCLNSNGEILFGGYENATYSAGPAVASTVSVVGQVVGNSPSAPTVYTQVKRFPGAVVIGQINEIVNLTTNGAGPLANGQPKAIHTFSSGTFTGYTLVAQETGATSTVLNMLDATTYALNTSSGATSFGSGTGSFALSGAFTNPSKILVDTADNNYVLGTSSGAVAVIKINAAGTLGILISLPTPTATTGLTAAYDMVQTASGKILITGFNSIANSGVILSYDPVLGSLDTSFNPSNGSGVTSATPGCWFTGIAHPVMSIAIGASSNLEFDADKIFFAYQNGTNAIVYCLRENGTELEIPSLFTFGTPIALVSSDTQIRMQLDASGKIVLVANTSTGIQAARYLKTGANSVVPAVIIAAASTLQEILTLSDGMTLILSQNTGVLDIAYVNAAFVLDTNYNPSGTIPGILSTTVSPQIEFWAIDVLGGVAGFIVAGDTSATPTSAVPYFTQITNIAAVTKVQQSASELGSAGTIDITLNPSGTNPGFLNLHTELTSFFPLSTAAKVLFQNQNGSYYIAGDNGTNSYVTFMTDDDLQISTFGATGLLTITGKFNISNMLVSQTDQLLVAGGAGGSGSHAGWLQSFNASTGVATPGFTPPSGSGQVLDTVLYAIAQQSNGRILTAGILNDVGTIAAHNSVTGAVDTTFGVNGFYTATGYNGINSIIVDAQDNIYFIAVDTTFGSSYTVKLSASGATVLATCNVAPSNGVTASNHVAFDQNNDIVASTLSSSNGDINIIRYGSSDLVQMGDNLAIAVPGISIANVTSLVIDQQPSTAGKVIIAGFDSSVSPSAPYIARILTDLSGFDTSYNGNGVQTYNTVSGGVITQWNDAMINENGKITVAGYASVLTDAYIMRTYGDEFIGQYLPIVGAGIQGTIDTNFANAGYLSLIGTATLTGIPEVIVPLTNGSQYVAFNDGTLARYTNATTPVLDTTYHTTGIAVPGNPGVFSMTMIADGSLVLAGTAPAVGLTPSYGWIQQYATDGTIAFTTNFSAGTQATVAVQQSISRLVVAGQLANGHAALFGFTNAGVADATFAVNSAVGTGILDGGIITPAYALIADEYDRLIVASQYGGNIDITRLTSSGELDLSFGSNGIIIGAISLADDATQVRLAFDVSGNIVVAAHTSTPAIVVKAYVNGSGTVITENQLAITALTSPILTDLIATADGKILVSGNQSGANDMWVARLVNSSGTYALDISTTIPAVGNVPFAPAPALIPGIMQFDFDEAGTVTGRSVNSIAIYSDGEISMVGTETQSSATLNNPFMSRAYNNPYTSQESIDLGAKAPGTMSLPFGVTTAVANGITFFATTGVVTGASNQVAEAVVMQAGNDNGIVVAFDGQPIDATDSSQIFINMFDVDGLLNTNFKNSTIGNCGPGQALVLSQFDNQYVNDMLTFTVDGISKAILAGYATNTTPALTGSLLIQYNLDLVTPGLDTNFGGLNGNAPGLAFGDAQTFYTIGQQSNGAIIAGGNSYSGFGVIVRYTASGNLDQSFGQGTSMFVIDAPAIYASAIDSQDRIVVASSIGGDLYLYRILADGSELDPNFNGGNPLLTEITDVVAASNLCVAIDPSGNIAVAAVVTGGITFQVARYTTDGVLSTVVNTIGSTMSLTALTITKMLIDANGAIVLIGYNTDVVSPYDQVVVARLVYSSTTYILDTTFNASAGFITYEVNATGHQMTAGGFIHPNGSIIVGGSQEPLV